MTLRTLQQLADLHNVPLRTLHLRRKDRNIEGKRIGNCRVFGAKDQRRLLKAGVRGRKAKRKGAK